MARFVLWGTYCDNALEKRTPFREEHLAGMPDYTCNCVVQEMKKKKSVEQAKVTCKAAAEKKYNL